MKLALFDIDGTLIEKGTQILSESTKNAVNLLKKHKVTIAVASGRPIFMIDKNLLEQLQFDFFICANGTFVANHEMKELFRDGISPDISVPLLEEIEKDGFGISLNFEDNNYAYSAVDKMQELRDFFIGNSKINRAEGDQLTRHLTSYPTSGVAYIPNDKVDRYIKKYPTLKFVKTLENYYDVMHINSSKGKALEKLADYLNISLKETIAFGDDYNDIEMLETAGVGVAMGNAVSDLKNIADYITTEYNKNGIWNALKFYNLI